MLPLRLVVDTNILVSAALKPESLQRTVLLIAFAKPARLYVSRPILEEYREVLARPELGIRRGVRLQMLQFVKVHGHLIEPDGRLDISSDRDDNKFLECADAAGADYLITGNQRHFPAAWKKTKVIGAREFVFLVAPDLVPWRYP